MERDADRRATGSGTGGAFAAAAVFAATFALANATLGSTLLHPALSIATTTFAAAASAAAAWAARRLATRPDVIGGAGPSPRWLAVMSAALALTTLTSFAYRGDYFLAEWAPSGQGPGAILRAGCVQFAILAPCAAPAFQIMARKGLWARFLALLLVAAELLAALALFRFTGMSAIYTDDHPSFMFRLAEFWGSFPWRENYVPHWNAGVVNSVVTSSGIPGYAVFSAPLHFIFRKPHLYHTAAIAAYHLLFAPWLVAWGLRACRRDWPTALTGGLLALFANGRFFVWALRFGTAGAAVSWAAAPAALLFAYAIAEVGRSGWRETAGLALSASLLCAWPQAWLFAAAIALAALSSARRLFVRGGRRRALALAVALSAVLLATAPSLVAAARSSDLVGYVSERPAPAGVAALLAAACLEFKATFSSALVAQANPLVVVFGLAGMWSMRPTAMRRWLAIAAAIAAAAFSAGPVFYPNAQLDRMAVPLSMTLAVPAAVCLGDLWRARRHLAAPLQGAAAALLVLGAVSTARIYAGGGVSSFEPIDPSIRALAAWIAKAVPYGSRAAFAGRTAHAFGHGHVAYLPILAGREMMACDYYEFPRGTFEPDFPPIAARGQEGGLRAYFAEHRVSHVITCRPNYIALFESDPLNYEPGPRFNYHHATGDVDIRTFTVKGPRPDDGCARVTATFNKIDVSFDGTPPQGAVLAYHWHDRLRASPPAEIRPAPTTTPGETPFIEVLPHEARHVTIKYRNRF